MTQPRPEYPRPQFVRQDWLNLNGEWQFEIDMADTGLERGLKDRELSGTITVPFCPESELSGVHNTDFLNAVWYRKTVEIPASWAGKRVLVHFQAVDYDATVWANGVEVGRHRGGATPFFCDLSGLAEAGQTVTLVVRARDFTREMGPRGKQSQQYNNHGCLYIRTTGIWQTVWLEAVPQTYLQRPRITPDVASSRLILEQRITGIERRGKSYSSSSENASGMMLRATAYSDGNVVAVNSVPVRDFSPRLDLTIAEEFRRLWHPGHPHLYDITLELLDANGNIVDTAQTYAGLRSLQIDGKAVLINGEPVFQRLVLDQGYYPDGILTAPSDDALKNDIQLALDAGFNGARLHQKVFEERFLYHCDRMGYIVWGEFPDWGCNTGQGDRDNQQPTVSYFGEWLECLERDYSHPAIVGWCPLNETWQLLHDRITTLDVVTRGLFLATKAFDGTRPVLDTSGYAHRVLETDIYDSHDYDQNPETFKARHDLLTTENKPFVNLHNKREMSTPYKGQPYFVSEFGGIWWNPDAKPEDFSWGYGERPKTIEEFYIRFEGLCNALLDNPSLFAYCYTQLTDVYQEQNGIYTFDRRAKFDGERIRAIQTRRAAIEQK